MSQSSGRGDAEDTMERRVPGSRLKLWLLLGANRWLLTGVVLGGLFAVFLVLGALDPAPLRAAAGSKDPVETLFQALLTAIVTGVTLVVTINQLVLSQELGAVGDQRERMEGAVSFRRDVESVLDRPVGPADPSSFLRAIVEESATRGQRLTAAAENVEDEELRDRIGAFVEGLRENATEVSGRLDDARFGTFEVMSAALDYNYSEKIHEARRLRRGQPERLTEDAGDALEAVVEVLELYAPAREHFKTLYFQWELINLSRAVLYAAVPALAVTAAMILYVDNPATITGRTLGVDHLVWLVSGAAVVALAPFVLLLSYILRITTVAKRTLAIGPFVLRTTD
jgi:hypothetical protein